MAKQGVKLHCYMDDYIVVASKSKGAAQFTLLCDLLKHLGLPLNQDKVTPPTKKLACLGIDIDINSNTMSIAQDKLQDIYEAYVQASNKTYLSRQAFQSLFGKLIYIHKCVKPSRIFINRILELFRKNNHCRKIYLNSEFHLEMLNIVIALRVWGPFWQHGSISVHCDNLGVVQVVKTGKTRDSFLALCIRNIWLLTSSYDIDLNVNHILGVNNVIADTLSRIYSDRPVNYDILLDLQQNYKWEKVFAGYFDLDTHL